MKNKTRGTISLVCGIICVLCEVLFIILILTEETTSYQILLCLYLESICVILELKREKKINKNY